MPYALIDALVHRVMTSDVLDADDFRIEVDFQESSPATNPRA